jgi:hypothetical protein
MADTIFGKLLSNKTPRINASDLRNNVDFFAVISKLNQSHTQRRIYDSHGNIAIDTTNI